MCQICAAFNPTLIGCEYIGITTEPGDGVIAAPGDTIVETGDAGTTTTTADGIAVGEFFSGELQTGTDTDWIAVDLVAGQTYTFAGVGTGAVGTAVFDLVLGLRDENGVLLDSSDRFYITGYDAFGDPIRTTDFFRASESFTFTATESGTYYIEVSSHLATQDGTYGVSVVEGTDASYNVEMGAGHLLRPELEWVNTPETSVTLTWAFRDTGTPYDDPNNPSIFDGTPLEQLNANQRLLAQGGMDYLDDISGVNFVHVNPTGTSDNATILFGAYTANDGAGAFAYYPGSTSPTSRNGDIWLNNTSFNGQTYGFGTYVAYTMLHEIGHAIGLAHPGDYNAGTGGPITYANSAEFLQDSQQYTVMSYFSGTNTGVSSGLGFPDTFMLYDFMAIHQLYGANVNYNAGNTVYGFNVQNADLVYDFTFNTTPYMTIYDGQGDDTIDLSGYAMAQFLTLEEGKFSNIGGYENNFSIAFGAVIENAIGGTGNDTINGNAVANNLSGGDGEDSIMGGAGDDTIDGGGQADHLEGGEGFDTISGGMGNDTILGGKGNDRVIGGNGNDMIFGGEDNDTLSGQRGDDTVDGGDGNDRLRGLDGNDSLVGGKGNDRMLGGEGEDTLIGGEGNDRLLGGFQEDYLDGGIGNDALIGGGGRDTLIGGEGDDTMSGKSNADTFIFNDMGGTIDLGNDLITDFDATVDNEKLDFSGLSTLNTLFDVLGNGVTDGAALQVGNDVVITTLSGVITLENVLLSDLDAADFIF